MPMLSVVSVVVSEVVSVAFGVVSVVSADVSAVVSAVGMLCPAFMYLSNVCLVMVSMSESEKQLLTSICFTRLSS